jgi:hypothetical protein
MEKIIKTNSKKISSSNNISKRKNGSTYQKSKAAERKYILQHLVHPDYILFDWEFFSRELEFE